MPTIVSWNLFGLEDRHLDVRTEAAMGPLLLGRPVVEVLQGAPARPLPDVVLLQEVVPRTLDAHLRPHLERAGYTLWPNEPPPRNYFEIVAVRQPIVSAEHRSFARSGMGRILTWVELEDRVVATSHLESLKAGGPVRCEQAQFVLDAMQAEPKPVFFAGDTNLRQAEADALSFTDTVDAFEAIGAPSAHRATWGGRARFDRAWVNGSTVQDFETFGGARLDAVGVPCSDHLGIRVTLR